VSCKNIVILSMFVISIILLLLPGCDSSDNSPMPVGTSSYTQIVKDYGMQINGQMSEGEVEEVFALVQTHRPSGTFSYITKLTSDSYEVGGNIGGGGDCSWSYGQNRILLLKRQNNELKVVDDRTMNWDSWGNCTPTPTPTQTPIGAGKLYPVPEKPADWQELPAKQKDANNISFYFPGEWVTMTSQPLPTIIWCLDPIFFPNCELRVYNIPDGTTNAQFREIIKNKYPSERGGEYDDFQVFEEGDITLDNGFQTVYMIHKGTRMGYAAQAIDVFMARGTQGFVIQADDYPVTFEDSKPLAMQIVKTLYSTIPIPGEGGGTPTPPSTATSTPSVSLETQVPSP